MTCIVGLVDDQKVWIGADSHANAGCERFRLAPVEQKIVRWGDMLIGVTGPSRMTQILGSIVIVPHHDKEFDTFAYLVRRVVPALKSAIEEHGGVKINDSSDGWEFLLGYRGGLYLICHDLSVTVLPSYGAVGCGAALALGSLHTTGVMTQEEHWSPQDRLLAALEAAATHDVHVAPPFLIEEAA